MFSYWVKLIQNLEIKMESQINSLEARIEKMGLWQETLGSLDFCR